MTVVENGMRNLYRAMEEVVIMSRYYQGLFLKKPPLTPQKLPNYPRLLRSLG